MKRYLVTLSWKGIFDDDDYYECSSLGECKKNILKRNKIKGKIVYDSKTNMHVSRSRYIVIQEGYIDGNTRYIRGKRYFYLIDTNKNHD